MDILDPTCFPLDDPLFDITLDGEDDVNLKKTVSEGGAASVSSPLPSSNATTPFGTETQSGLFSHIVDEEELEWISNKDAFPSLESCLDMLPENPDFMLNYHSPASVLENNNGSNSNSNANSNGCVVISSSDSVQVPTNDSVGARSIKGRKIKRTKVVPMRPPPKIAKNNLDSNGIPLKCSHCQTDKTPQWRGGPMGPKTLCNACGVRYISGRLWPEYRPANSPTFSTENNSNSHRKVIEMRKQKHVEVGSVFDELLVVPNNAD